MTFPSKASVDTLNMLKQFASVFFEFFRVTEVSWQHIGSSNRSKIPAIAWDFRKSAFEFYPLFSANCTIALERIEVERF